MKLILEIRSHADDEQVSHRVVERFPITVGRAYHNDVILHDPFVDPKHLRIDYDGETCTVTDLDSGNGLLINMQPKGKLAHKVSSGDTLQIGHTKVRIYTPDHPVPPAVRVQKTHPIFAWLGHSPNVWATYLLAMAIALSWCYLEIWSDQPKMVLASGAAAITGIVVLWSALWSVAGRLLKHKARFKSHVAMISIYIVASIGVWYVNIYTDFLTGENWLSVATTYGFNFITLCFLLYGALTVATHMSRERRKAFAAFFSGGVMAGIFLFGLVGMRNFSQQPLFSSVLEPYLSRFAHADTLSSFMESNAGTFLSDEFEQDEKPPALPAPRQHPPQK
jgi:hypothetical protein